MYSFSLEAFFGAKKRNLFLSGNSFFVIDFFRKKFLIIDLINSQSLLLTKRERNLTFAGCFFFLFSSKISSFLLLVMFYCLAEADRNETS